ncbi:hypothetical protein SKAU_G00259500 [Synaphobranchus kaupii]|uniref:Uncharacterized protein n=1 Tax=Synaphobranchus kaupii TaxID=118154 RepID=A0A9Q1F4F9_SYNKA|nr:hypothetical protein SKAU_G00259500 [Synaphobranchus kaupii]
MSYHSHHSIEVQNHKFPTYQQRYMLQEQRISARHMTLSDPDDWLELLALEHWSSCSPSDLEQEVENSHPLDRTAVLHTRAPRSLVSGLTI